MSTKRLNYFKGEFLHVDDFKDEQLYHLKAHRLHNKKLHTWGVVNGLDVTFVTGEKKVTISQGMAVDGEGRQIIHDTVKEIDFTADAALVTVQYVTVSFLETPSDPTEETGIKDYTRITEEAVFKCEKDPPADQSMALILAKVTLNGDKTVQAVDTGVRKYAGVLAGDLEAISVAFKLPVAADQWPKIEGTAADKGIQVTSPSTKLTGNLTVVGSIGIGSSVTPGKLAVNGGLHVGGESDPGNKNLQVDGSCTINGNLTVKGATTTVSTTNVEVADNVITVNKGATVALTGGLEVYRGGGTVKNAQIIWDENTDLWKVGIEGGLDTVATRSSNLFTGNQEIAGNLKVTSLTPSAGNAESNGIMFPRDPGGGGGDAGWIRYYPRTGEACTLEIGTANDVDDHIALMASGNVGIGITAPNDKLDVAGNLRILTGSNPIRFTPGWSSFPDAAGIVNQAEICNDTGTYKTLMIVGNKSAGLGRRVSIWDRLEVNGPLLVTGNLNVAGAIQPSAGNAETNGIMFPKDPGGGGGDAAWIRYYPRSGEACTLAIGTSDNADDHIALMPSGNIGVGTVNPIRAKLETVGMIGNTLALFGQNVRGISLVGSDACVGFNTYFNGGWKAIAPGGSGVIDSDANGNLHFYTGPNAAAADAAVTITERLTISTLGNVMIPGALTPSAGNAETNGIMFPKDIAGGSGDAAWIRYYPRSGEACTLEIGCYNDADDHIALMASGNVGVKTLNAFQPLTVGDRAAVDGEGIMFRVVGDSPGSWKGGAAFGHNTAAVIMGELGGVATLGAHNANLTAWGNLAINLVGNVGIGTTGPAGKLDVNGDIRAGNSDIYFTKTNHNHSGIGNAAGFAAIENAADYGALMILGRAGTPVGRCVKLWDYLQVNGNVDITGNLGTHGYSSTPRTPGWGGGIHTWDIEAEGTTWSRNGYQNGNRDYAEYFESLDGKEILPGIAVILEGKKIRPAKKGEIPIGVISASPGVVGGVYKDWPEKYLKDVFGKQIMEEYREEVLVPKKEKVIREQPKLEKKTINEEVTQNKVVFENGKHCQKQVTEKITREVEQTLYKEVDLYDATGSKKIGKHQAPVMETWEEEIDVLDSSGKPVLIGTGEFVTKKRPKLNPKYDESVEYTIREFRPEWNCVGLLGQLPVCKGQAIAPNWIKLEDLSEEVELWLVK